MQGVLRQLTGRWFVPLLVGMATAITILWMGSRPIISRVSRVAARAPGLPNSSPKMTPKPSSQSASPEISRRASGQ